MNAIRPFHQDDVESVATLFQRIFRHSAEEAPESLKAYFSDLYLRHPLQDGTDHSLVYEDGGVVRGFIGGIPTRIAFRDHVLKALIGGNLMIDPQAKNPFAALNLLKAFFNGSQDITLTDTSNVSGRKMWENLGGVTLPLYSLQWLRVFSPSRFVLSLADRHAAVRAVGIGLRPFTAIADALASRMIPNKRESSRGIYRAERLTAETLLRGIQSKRTQYSCVPAYDESTLAWILSMARAKSEYGPLEEVALFDQRGELAGWYLYYPNRGKIGQVLQVVARRKDTGGVLGHLFEAAQSKGSSALIGRADPSTMLELSTRQCIFFQRHSFVQVRSETPGVVQALASGDAFFTRLEGEWWTRLQGDKFV